MAEVGTDDESNKETQTNERGNEIRMGHDYPETHAKQKGKDGATASFGYSFTESESVAIHCMLQRERDGGKEGRSRHRESRRQQTAQHRMRNESGIQNKSSE